MSEEAKDAKVLAAAKRLAKAYLKYGKELDAEIEALAKAATKRWPELEKLS
jgi:hypothetical protein